jgi:hypothetical protein
MKLVKSAHIHGELLVNGGMLYLLPIIGLGLHKHLLFSSAFSPSFFSLGPIKFVEPVLDYFLRIEF